MAFWRYMATGRQGQGRQGQGNRDRGTGTGKGNISRFHALCGNCKENIAKTRIKTEISRKTRKFLLKNLLKAKICRTFALSKRKTKKNTNTNVMKENYTIMRFKSMKEKHPDALLLFRYGDAYITYNEDAVTASRVLGITLIRRSEGYDMAGFPTVLLDDFLPKLIRAGHRIVIFDKIEFA